MQIGIIIALLFVGLLILFSAVMLAAAGLTEAAATLFVADCVVLFFVGRRLRREARRRRRLRRRSSVMGQRDRAQRVPVVSLDLSRQGRPVGGVVLTGSRSGQRLESMSLDALLDLGASIDDSDTQSLALLVRYLDSVHPGWRRTRTADAGGADERSRPDGPAPWGADPHIEQRRAALRLLGLREGATQAEICEAHRRLIKQVHPDVGGSASLTAEVNVARAVLLAQGSNRRIV